MLAEVVVAVLKAYGTESAAVAEEACGAIYRLSVNEELATALAAAGACEGK